MQITDNTAKVISFNDGNSVNTSFYVESRGNYFVFGAESIDSDGSTQRFEFVIDTDSDLYSEVIYKMTTIGDVKESIRELIYEEKTHLVTSK